MKPEADFPAAALARRITTVSESQTLAMAGQVRRLRAEGRDIVSLTLGEPDFDTPEHIKAAGVAAIKANQTHYPPVAGTPELRRAAAQFLHEVYGLAYTPDEIIVSAGAKQSILNAFMALLDPTDEVVLFAPYWVSYVPMCQMAEGRPVVVAPNPDAPDRLNLAGLEAALTPRAKIVVLNNPSNPAGTVFPPEDIEALAAVLAEWPRVWVVSDEIYSLIRYDVPYQSPAAVASLRDRTITVNGCSKAFAMTGWRIGIAAGPAALINACEKYQGQVTSGACSIAQAAAAAAFGQSLTPSLAMVAEFRHRRDAAYAHVAARCPAFRTALPQGAFYLYPDVSAYLGLQTPSGRRITTATDLAAWLLEGAGVAVVSGEAFGSPTHLRLSYACEPEVFAAGIDRIAQGLARLR
jgi:aspartate aminotransferase